MALLHARTRGTLLATVIVTAVFAGCGGSGGAGGGATEGGGDTSAPACTEPAGDLGEGNLCADSGFRMSVNDFRFPNWEGVEGRTDKPGAALMVRMFGADAVCASGTGADDCELNPAAQSTVEAWEEALDGGHCEGMATLSLRYFLGLQDTADASSGATDAAEITRPSMTVDQEIVMWWATQFVPEVRSAAAATRQKDPVELVQELITGLRDRTGFTVGIYADGFGHAVTPYAVTKNGSVYSVHIYDNNFPGEQKAILVDETTRQWRYEDGTENPDGTPYVWSGGTGTFELTPMAVRSGPFDDEFGAVVDNAKGSTVISLSAAAAKGATRQPAAGLLVTTAGGKRVGIVDGAVVNEVPGAAYTVGKGGLGTSLVLVEMPSLQETYTVQPVSATRVDSTVERQVTVSVSTPDGSRTQVRGTRRLARPAATSNEIVLDPAAGVSLRPAVDSEVTVTNNRDSVRVRVPRDGSLVASGTRTGDGASVTGKAADGRTLVQKTLRKAVARVTRAGGTGTGGTGSSVPRTTVDATGSSVPRSTLVPRSTTTTTRVPRSTTTTTRVPRSTTTTTRVPRSTTTTTAVARTTLVPRSTTTTVPRTTTTVPRTTLVPRSTTTTVG